MTYWASMCILSNQLGRGLPGATVSALAIIKADARFVYRKALFVYKFLVLAGEWESRQMPKRFITRIELTVPTRTKLTDVSHSNGMTQVAVLSRIVQWFAAQPETIQAAILGRYPVEIEPDVAKLLLERMANGQKK